MRTPLGDLPLDDALRRRLQRHEAGVAGGRRRHPAGGVRGRRDRGGPPGRRDFEAPIEIVESMGSEIYAYFGYEGGDIDAAELQELEADSGANEARGMQEGSRAVARLDADERRPPGPEARLWIDTSKMHLFDPHSGASLTRDPDPERRAPRPPRRRRRPPAARRRR